MNAYSVHGCTPFMIFLQLSIFVPQLLTKVHRLMRCRQNFAALHIVAGNELNTAHNLGFESSSTLPCIATCRDVCRRHTPPQRCALMALMRLFDCNTSRPWRV